MVSATSQNMAKVFPAHAGMSPGTHPAGAHLVSFPRSRGDEPPRVLFFDLAAMFSPLTRG